jgi:hypothetical protein
MLVVALNGRRPWRLRIVVPSRHILSEVIMTISGHALDFKLYTSSRALRDEHHSAEKNLGR